MKITRSLLSFFIIGSLIISGTKANGINSQKTNFNAGWKFHKGDVPNAEQPSFDDTSWENIDLPHDWSIKGTFSPEWASGTAFLPGGIGWYRKTFNLPKTNGPKNIYIYFDGVYKNSEVWINGHYLGKRPNGFIPFYYELTDYLIPGKNNIIAVKVDHSDFADSRWYTGSGINRNVYLISTDPLHIDMWGVKFTTRSVPENTANINVAVTVVNDRSSAEKITLRAQLLDKMGIVAGTSERALLIDKGEKHNTTLAFQVNEPSLWSVDNPYLYTLQVELLHNDKTVEKRLIPVGIRPFRFDANQGFFLNGENMKLKGVCIHDDAGVFGTAVPKEVWAQRLKTLKNAGVNAIRMSHNPHADYLYDLCDELGLLVMDEAFDEWKYGKNKWIKGWNVGKPGKDGYSKYFDEWAERDIKDMVRRNQDHPSIIMWSIGNEIDYPNDPYTHQVLDSGRNPQIFGRGYNPDLPNIKEIEPVAKNLAKWVREVDTSRAITAALAGVAMSNFTSYPADLDVVGYNYQEYRYEEDHQKYPDRKIYGSENGMSLRAWKAVTDHDYIAGQFLWTGIDYLGEAGQWPSNHSHSGLLDLAGNPKPEYYFRKSIWNPAPMVYIGVAGAPEHDNNNIWAHKKAEPTWNWKPGEQVQISCFTNCEYVELFLNGKSLGKKALDKFPQKVLKWSVPFEEGTLIAKGYNNQGVEMANCQLQTTGLPVAIQAEIGTTLSDTEATGLHRLNIEVVDGKGQIVPSSKNIITVEVQGNGQLLGLESGDMDGSDNYGKGYRKVNHGKLVAFVQTDPQKGPMIVHLTSPGLEPKTITITTK